MRVECLTCHGTYETVLPDGLQYFHVCPPLSLVELQKAVDDRRVVLEPDETVEQAHERRVYERTLKRDERAVQRTTEKLPPQIVSEGRGVRRLPPPATPPGPIVVPD